MARRRHMRGSGPLSAINRSILAIRHPRTASRLLNRLQLRHERTDRGPFPSAHAHKLPTDDAFTIYDKNRRPRNPLLRVQHIVGSYETPGGIGQDWKRQTQFQYCLSSRGLRIRTQCDKLSAEFLNSFVILLQLTELRLAERSGVHPVKHDQNAFVTLEVIQVDRRALNGHTFYVRRLSILRECRYGYERNQ